MFKTQTNKKGKTAAEKKPQRADAATGKDSPEPNPVWQSLALSPLSIQPKLAISQPGDPYEQEADLIADRVMRLPAPLQRKCNPCEGELQPVRKSKSEVDKASQSASETVGEVLQSGGGRPLDPTTRAYFQVRFGHDFAGVRLHIGADAAASARAIDARAYTVGEQIVFGTDQYAPGTPGGHRLLSHELAHVVQQSNGAKLVQRQQSDTGQQQPLRQEQQPQQAPNLMKIYSFGPTGAGRYAHAAGTTIFPPPAPVDANGNELIRAGTTAQPILSRFGRYFTLDERQRALAPPVSDSRIIVETVWNADDRSESWRAEQEVTGTYYAPGEPLGSSLGSEYIFRNDRPGVLSLVYVLVNGSSAGVDLIWLTHRVHYVNDPAAPPGATVIPDQVPAGSSSG